MSNARKIADLVKGTEVKVGNIDSDISNTLNVLKARLDSDDGRLQLLSSNINSKIAIIKSRLDSDDAKLQALDTVISATFKNFADSDVIISQIQAKVNSIIANLDSDTIVLQNINTKIGIVKTRLDSDTSKLSSIDQNIGEFQSRLDSDSNAIQAAASLAASAASSAGMSDSDLKVVADLRNIIDSEILYVRSLNLSYTNYTYIATAGQTTFTGSDANSLTLAYTAGSIQVFLNGIRMEADDFTATDGTSVVLVEGAKVSAQLTIIVPKLESN